MPGSSTSDRKNDHININLKNDVRSGITTGLENYRFDHQALPEIELDQVSIETSFLGHSLDSPIIISSMTGGSEQAERINRVLAHLAQKAGLAIGVGSQRAAIENPQLSNTFNLRRFAPDLVLFANLGAVQLNYGYGLEECKQAVDMIDADGLILHLNSLQEAVQPEGDTNFAGLIDKIAFICEKLDRPVILKEVGWGISSKTARDLVDAGVAAIDVAGAGGTSWTQVELYRAKNQKQANLASAFINWGIPTSQSIVNVRKVNRDIPVIGSGGVRTGIEVAKCLALGANLTGVAGPFLKAAATSLEEAELLLEGIHKELMVCMFAVGVSTISELKKINLIKLDNG
jgi:isopentenyl-diphosphate delta-isomerase